ncbi:outer envelope pore protein 16, chloroplastic-like [Cucurbita pepo subsp. pepo]|uniref:outer envelope pore protein 16, chloroplastic-like n=1 Tax=Cucurbita pepo subsp. pepo TaxID=3664 RepID=UPI000C9D6D2C|nr:outer envelope pore protein 16, chloroplastic-like [Cucurbita pepo subsp. pepo]
MPRTGFVGSLSTPKVDVVIDMGNPFLNLTVDGFLKIGSVAATRAAAEDAYHVVRKGTISSHNFENTLKKMCKEGAYWGTVAGVYVGMEYGVERIRGRRDWCRKVKEVGDLMTGEPATEAPVNGGRNYNGPKASQKVTEACKGFLGPDGDWPSSAKAEGSLTARPTRRAGTKVGLSDPTVPSGRAVAQRIKVTLGITG